MGKTLSPTTRRRLDVQGFSDVNDATLAEVAPWLRMAFALCAVLAGAGTALASPKWRAAGSPSTIEQPQT